jgi:hypothetical protein
MPLEITRLEYLVNRHFDELLVGEERAELERMLMESSNARSIFWEMARVNAVLRQWGQEEWGRKDGAQAHLRVLPPVLRAPKVEAMPRQVGRPSSMSPWWPLAAAAVFVIGFFVWTYLPQPTALESGVAVLTHTSDVVWGKDSEGMKAGSVLPPGWLHVKSGVLQVEFSRGARVVLEGPADFCLTSDNSGELTRGRLSAVVPEPAHGFAVRTPEFTVVDHGTKFGCLVPASGPPELHVFGGLVGMVADGTTKETRSLHANEAVRVDGDRIQSIPADAGAFIDEEELALRDRHGLHERLVAWQKFSREFSRHQDLVAYLDFQPDGVGARGLVNRAASSPTDSGAAIVGCDWAEGRWPGKGALEFKRTDDRVRMRVPGEFTSLTFMAWIRVDGLPNRLNALVSGENTERLGETQWYVYENGSLGIGVRIGARGTKTQWWHAHSPAIFKGNTFGTWTFVATVFDRKANKLTHYVNGQAVSSATIDVDPLLELGTMEIGNLGSHDGSPREAGNFEGRIDETAVLSTALSAGEIRRIYEAGSPGEAKSPAVVAQAN